MGAPFNGFSLYYKVFFWRKFAYMCLICGGNFFFAMIYAQNLMKKPERQWNSTSPDGEFFFLIFAPLYACNRPENLVPEWKFNVVSEINVINSRNQVSCVLFLIYCNGANSRIFDLIMFDELARRPKDPKNFYKVTVM